MNSGGTITIDRAVPTSVVVSLPDSLGSIATRYTYSISAASRLNLKYPSMTREQWHSSLILTYMVHTSNTIETYSVVPGKGAGDYWMYKNDKETESIIVFFRLGGYTPVAQGDYGMAKIIIIQPSGEPHRYSRRKLIEDLYKAGVHIEDYHQITNYFGMEN